MQGYRGRGGGIRGYHGLPDMMGRSWCSHVLNARPGVGTPLVFSSQIGNGGGVGCFGGNVCRGQLHGCGVFLVLAVYKTYYTSQREIWRDISRAEGE